MYIYTGTTPTECRFCICRKRNRLWVVGVQADAVTNVCLPSHGSKGCPDKTSWDKTSVGTKRPSDKTSVGTKRPADKTSGGQNVRRTKCPWGQNVRGQNVRLGHIYQGLARQFLLIKIYWAWRKNPLIHTYLSVGGWGEQYLKQRSFILIKTVYILKLSFPVGFFSKSCVDKRD